MKTIPSILFFFFCSAAFAQGGLWTWMKGDSALFAAGHYDSLGVASALNECPPRYACSSWTDTSGKFWLMGGGALNELWKFDPATVMWTCMKADSPFYKAAAKGVYHPRNQPENPYQGRCAWTTPDNH